MDCVFHDPNRHERPLIRTLSALSHWKDQVEHVLVLRSRDNSNLALAFLILVPQFQSLAPTLMLLHIDRRITQDGVFPLAFCDPA
jgi:hypothetical protein